MSCQAKSEPLEYLHLDSVAALFNAHQLLYDFGYRGKLVTDGGSAHIDMHMADQVTVMANVGDVLLYKTSPAPAVVGYVTYDNFTTGYDIT